MHKDIIIGDANADTVARWIAAKVTEIQWSSDLSPTDTFTTERMGLEEPSRETWGYLIRLHGQINRHTPLTAGFATVAGISKVADVMRCEVRQGGGNRSQVVIDCEWYIVSHVQWLIDQMSVVFAIVQIEGDQVGDIKPGDAQNSTPQPAQVGAGDGPQGDDLDSLICLIQTKGLGRKPESDLEMAAAWLAWHTMPTEKKPKLDTWLGDKFGSDERNVLNLQSSTFHNYKRKVPAERLSSPKGN